MSKIAKAMAAPVRRYFNPRFESLNGRLIALQEQVARLSEQLERNGVNPISEREEAELVQARYLAQIDVSDHNRGGRPPTFAELKGQAASAAQCDDPAYLEWCKLLEGWDAPTGPIRQYNRKLWEWAYIAEAVTQAGLMQPGRSAVGFGVGNEPLPALLASRGLDVLATDQGVATDDHWMASGELNTGLAGLRRPRLLSDGELERRVRVREVDMNDVPDDLGTFDVVWSSCVVEHLGSPQRGLDFIIESCGLLAPGGIAVHTTELELTPKATTADYGNCAVYRISDLLALAKRLPEAGCTATFNFAVSMDRPEDRWVSLQAIGHHAALPDTAHLKLAIADSVSTSFGTLIRKLP